MIYLPNSNNKKFYEGCENMFRELKPSFHIDWFMYGLKHYTKDRHFYVVENDKMVLFNHHAWHSDFI